MSNEWMGLSSFTQAPSFPETRRYWCGHEKNAVEESLPPAISQLRGQSALVANAPQEQGPDLFYVFVSLASCIISTLFDVEFMFLKGRRQVTKGGGKKREVILPVSLDFNLFKDIFYLSLNLYLSLTSLNLAMISDKCSRISFDLETEIEFWFSVN